MACGLFWLLLVFCFGGCGSFYYVRIFCLGCDAGAAEKGGEVGGFTWGGESEVEEEEFLEGRGGK